jgi:ABC-2 type transport system permease protein
MVASSEADVRRAMDAGQARAGIIIPPNFSTNLARGEAQVMILLDGSDSYSVQSGYSAASLISQRYALQLSAQKIERSGGQSLLVARSAALPITNSFRVLYNPDFLDLWFVLPAILGMLLQTAAVSQASLIIVREREVGTMEQILATPTRPLELLIGKLVPLLVLCFLIIGMILAIGVFWFGVAFKGNLLLYLALTFLFIISSLGLGFLISTIMQNQRQAQQVSTVLMLFSMLLTGVVYPRNTMPFIPRLIGSVLPLTYFIRISRGVIMKGVGFSFVWSDALALIVYGGVVLLTAALNFKKRLD